MSGRLKLIKGRFEDCAACKGSGYANETSAKPCRACNGEGRVLIQETPAPINAEFVPDGGHLCSSNDCPDH